MNLVKLTLTSKNPKTDEFIWDIELDYKFGAYDEHQFRVVEQLGTYQTHRGYEIGAFFIYDLDHEIVKSERKRDISLTTMALNKQLLKKERENKINIVLDENVT